MKKRSWIIGVWCVLLPVLCAWAAEERVRAYVDRTTLAPGESLELRVTVEGGEGRVDTGGLSDFKAFPRGTSTSVRIINNNTSRQETHTFLLIPQRQGNLTIPSLAVTVDGTVYQTRPIEVTVSSRGAAEEDKTPEVWVEVSLSETEPYVGQQITYRFSLFQTVQVSSGTLEPPEFDGFSTRELKDRDSRRKIIDGREVVITDIYYILVPLTPGALTIEPATLQLGIVRENRRRRSPFDDFFDDPLFNRGRIEPKILQSRPLVVQVRPLPPWQGEAPFSGLVGRFEMTAETETTQLAVGDSTTLTVTLEGRGNLMDAQAPALILPEGLKTYADAPEEKIQLGTEGYQGKKVFRTALVPVEPGKLPLPPVQLTYFDVGEKRYRTLTAPLPTLSVQSGTQEDDPMMAATPSPQENKAVVTFTGRDILPPKENLDAVTPQRPLTWPLFLVWMVSPAVLVGLISMVQRLKRTDTHPSAVMRSRARHALKSAQNDRSADPSAFLTALYQALTSAIYARVGRSGEALAWKEAETLLIDSDVESGQARQAAELLTAIESARFSGAALRDAERQDLLERTRRMIRRLAP